MVRGWFATIVACGLACAGTAAAAQDAGAGGGGGAAASAAANKGVNTYSSVNDGQPNDPGQWGGQALVGYAANDWQGQATVDWTPKGKFGSNALFSVNLPTVTAGSTNGPAEISASLSWQQRWIGTNDSDTNIATIFTVQLPVADPNQSTDYVGTFAVTQLVGPGIAYFNAFVETQNGPRNPLPTIWSLLLGYKMMLTNKLSVVGDAIYSRGRDAQFELSMEYDFNDNFSVGPGVFLNTYLQGPAQTTAGVGLLVNLNF